MRQWNHISVKKATRALGIATLLISCMSLSADEESSKAFINVSTRLCLDSNAEGKVYTLGCNGGTAEPAQRAVSQQDTVSFRDWEGAWNMMFEYKGAWHSAQMIIKATDSGIRASYDFGRLQGTFDRADVSTATGQIENTTGTGATCSSGRQTGSFSLTLAVDGRSMVGWWDVCSAGPKYRWKAEKRG